MIKLAPQVTLAHTPTPLQHLERLSAETGVAFFVKRDDMTGDTGLGGNKVRKLEFLLAEALSRGATHVLTTGGPQSNHARATAAAAARLGLRCVLILAGRDPGTRDGNLLLNRLLGADIRFPGATTPADQAHCLSEAAAQLRSEGATPYVIPVGGSTPLGALGPYQCYREIATQLPGDAWIAFATGSGGTHAGLALGECLHGRAVRLQGFSVWLSAATLGPITAGLRDGAANLLGQPAPTTVPLQIDDTYIGPGYGKASPQGLAAVELVARLEGIFLDHIYTGKAMAGLLDYIRRGTIRPGERVLFIHTGGVPAIFAGMDEH